MREYQDLLNDHLGNSPKSTNAGLAGKTDNILIAGWVCTCMCAIFPVFILGSIFCGINAVDRGLRKQGLLIMCLAPFVSIIGVVFLFTTITLVMTSVVTHALPKVENVTPYSQPYVAPAP